MGELEAPADKVSVCVLQPNPAQPPSEPRAESCCASAVPKVEASRSARRAPPGWVGEVVVGVLRYARSRPLMNWVLRFHAGNPRKFHHVRSETSPMKTSGEGGCRPAREVLLARRAAGRCAKSPSAGGKGKVPLYPKGRVQVSKPPASNGIPRR